MVTKLDNYLTELVMENLKFSPVDRLFKDFFKFQTLEIIGSICSPVEVFSLNEHFDTIQFTINLSDEAKEHYGHLKSSYVVNKVVKKGAFSEAFLSRLSVGVFVHFSCKLVSIKSVDYLSIHHSDGIFLISNR